MRRTFLSRLLTAMFGLWFTFTLVQPTGMIGMTMSGGSASTMTGMSMVGMSMSDMAMMDMSRIDMSGMDMSSADMAKMHATNNNQSRATVQIEKVANTESGSSEQTNAPQECDQHDCCCSAVPLTMLAPHATLAWLPEHVINQDTPQTGDCVAHPDGQLRLPFANGPPAAVIA